MFELHNLLIELFNQQHSDMTDACPPCKKPSRYGWAGEQDRRLERELPT
jgi:hypothetical protein